MHGLDITHKHSHKAQEQSAIRQMFWLQDTFYYTYFARIYDHRTVHTELYNITE